jgi:hypothetical protein
MMPNWSNSAAESLLVTLVRCKKRAWNKAFIIRGLSFVSAPASLFGAKIPRYKRTLRSRWSCNYFIFLWNAGRELKTAISLLNLRQFSRVPKKLPSNWPVNGVAVGGHRWTPIALPPRSRFEDVSQSFIALLALRGHSCEHGHGSVDVVVHDNLSLSVMIAMQATDVLRQCPGP